MHQLESRETALKSGVFWLQQNRARLSFASDRHGYSEGFENYYRVNKTDHLYDF